MVIQPLREDISDLRPLRWENCPGFKPMCFRDSDRFHSVLRLKAFPGRNPFAGVHQGGLPPTVQKKSHCERLSSGVRSDPFQHPSIFAFSIRLNLVLPDLFDCQRAHAFAPFPRGSHSVRWKMYHKQERDSKPLLRGPPGNFLHDRTEAPPGFAADEGKCQENACRFRSCGTENMGPTEVLASLLPSRPRPSFKRGFGL